MTAFEHVDGPGERLVRLLTCMERCTHEVERELPSVDHLALRRSDPDPESVLAMLRAQGPYELVEAFDAWRHLLKDFEVAVAKLIELRDQEDRSEDDQEHLSTLIADARQCRQAVEHLAADIRRRVASHIDLAEAHEISAD